MMLKPAQLVLRRKGDPEQLFKDWDNYINVFKEFLEATGVVGTHADPEIPDDPCAACVKVKNMLRLIGGDEVRTLFDHVGMVEGRDNWQQSLDEVSQGIKQQTNESAARFKLMQKMPQSDSCFAEWYPLVKEQAERCTWQGYIAGKAARDAILLQTRDRKLQEKILAEDLSYADTIRYGLALEQGRKKVEEINMSRDKHEDSRVAWLEEQVRKLQTDEASTSVFCQTCTRSTHAGGECPGKKVECFSCGLLGHFRGAAVCKGKKATGERNEEANYVSEVSDIDSDTETDSIGRVEKIGRATCSRGQSLSQLRQEDSRVARLEEQVRRLQSTKPSSSVSCQTCTRLTHAPEGCPGRRGQCFTCGLIGHFRYSAACKGKKAAYRKKKKIKEKLRKSHLRRRMRPRWIILAGLWNQLELQGL